MKILTFGLVLATCALTSCTTTTKPLSQVHGSYRPINESGQNAFTLRMPRFFDLKYRGTPHGALLAMQNKQERLTILAPRGREMPAQVDIDLHQVSLESAVKILALQGGNTFQIILKNDPVTMEDTAFVQFLK